MIAAIAAAAATIGCTKKVQVPDVKELASDRAAQTLAAAQLKAGKTTAAQGSVLPGAKVVTQSVGAGQMVAIGTPVDLVVESSVVVPKLTDAGAADALITIQNAGLQAAVKKKSFSLTHWGKVVDQDVPAGTEVARDTVVSVTVATPPDLGMLTGLLTQEPAYQRLNEKQRKILDQLVK